MYKLPDPLPLGRTPKKLKQLHNSTPANPLLAEPMYLTAYIERLGTGTTDMLKFAKKTELRETFFIQDDASITNVYRLHAKQVTGQVCGQITFEVGKTETLTHNLRSEASNTKLTRLGPYGKPARPPKQSEGRMPP